MTTEASESSQGPSADLLAKFGAFLDSLEPKKEEPATASPTPATMPKTRPPRKAAAPIKVAPPATAPVAAPAEPVEAPKVPEATPAPEVPAAPVAVPPAVELAPEPAPVSVFPSTTPMSSVDEYIGAYNRVVIAAKALGLKHYGGTVTGREIVAWLTANAVGWETLSTDDRNSALAEGAHQAVTEKRQEAANLEREVEAFNMLLAMQSAPVSPPSGAGSDAFAWMIEQASLVPQPPPQVVAVVPAVMPLPPGEPVLEPTVATPEAPKMRFWATVGYVARDLFGSSSHHAAVDDYEDAADATTPDPLSEEEEELAEAVFDKIVELKGMKVVGKDAIKAIVYKMAADSGLPEAQQVRAVAAGSTRAKETSKGA